MLRKRLLFIVFLLGLHSVSSGQERYSFFMAGHTYGGPGEHYEGMFPPFAEMLPFIKRQPGMFHGFLLGDIANGVPKRRHWDNVDAQIETLGFPVKYVPGNHDLVDPLLFFNRYGPDHFAFEYNTDLFVGLNVYYDQWHLRGTQLHFLEQQIGNFNHPGRNIFIFLHHLIWWEPDREFSDVMPNSFENAAYPLNFWSEIFPWLQSLPYDVYISAGDIGATTWAPGNKLFYEEGNVHFLATGMGNRVDDNFILIHVGAEGEVEHEFICLDASDPYCFSDEVILAGPNPTSDFLLIQRPDGRSTDIKLIDFDGHELIVSHVAGTLTVQLDVRAINPGVYILQFISEKKTSQRLIAIRR